MVLVRMQYGVNGQSLAWVRGKVLGLPAGLDGAALTSRVKKHAASILYLVLCILNGEGSWGKKGNGRKSNEIFILPRWVPCTRYALMATRNKNKSNERLRSVYRSAWVSSKARAS